MRKIIADMEILIRKARILDPSTGTDTVSDLCISGQTIVGIGKNLRKKPGSVVLDGAGLWLLPGLIDLHCHLREPGNEEEETILSGAQAASSGGFTTICCHPNTEPPADNKVVVRYIFDRAHQAPIEVLPYGAITVGRKGVCLAPMGEMAEAGVVGFSDDGNCVMDSLIFRRALEYSKIFGRPVVSHSEDHNLSRNGVMNEGLLATKLGLRGIPREAETVMVYRDICLAGLTGGRLHLAHLSTRESVEIVRRIKNKIPNVTCETTVHHLILTEEALVDYDTNAKVNPPLRTRDDISALVSGIKDGTIDAIVTDHAPHSEEEKGSGMENAPFGMIGFETALPLALSLVKYGLKLLDILACLTVKPSRILGLPPRTLAAGARADCVLFDPDKEWVYSRAAIRSKSKNSPFIGQTLKGRCVCTICRGEIVFKD
jgi:dihydroorotase